MNFLDLFRGATRRAGVALVLGAIGAVSGCATEGDVEESTDDLVLGSSTMVTSAGPVRGTRTLTGEAFRGIPFAASPVGALRWRAPEPPKPWTEVREATRFGPKCVQAKDDGTVEGTEDCLQLNVWRPKGAGSGSIPVMVFFYGGYNSAGSTSEKVGLTDFYDGAKLAAGGNVIVVTANYRVGALGFLAHPSLASSASGASGPAAGNYGLLDQIAALRWVQDNAKALGGDPKRVTVFGQSAGAYNTCALVASPKAKGLFSRAAMHSGGCRALARPAAESVSGIVADRLGCKASSSSDVAKCLRERSPTELAKAATMTEQQSGAFYWPVVDGDVLPKRPLAMIEAGEHNHVPILLGSTRDEASVIVRNFDPGQTEESLRGVIESTWPDKIGEEVRAVYPIAKYDSAKAAFQAALGDSAFICPTRRAARAFAAGQKESVRKFEFTHSIDDLLFNHLGASHGFDLFFVFENFAHLFPTPRERRLSQAFMGYWSRFAATGDPNGSGATSWPAYDPKADSALVLGADIKPGRGSRGTECEFWDRVATTLQE